MTTGYGFHIDSDVGRVGRFWFKNTDPILRTVPGTQTKFMTWGSFGWGGEVTYKFCILGEITKHIRDYFNNMISRINSSLSDK